MALVHREHITQTEGGCSLPLCQTLLWHLSTGIQGPVQAPQHLFFPSQQMTSHRVDLSNQIGVPFYQTQKRTWFPLTHLSPGEMDPSSRVRLNPGALLAP